jgi:hypothetical protein
MDKINPESFSSEYIETLFKLNNYSSIVLILELS